VTNGDHVVLVDMGLNAVVRQAAFQEGGNISLPRHWMYKPAEEIFSEIEHCTPDRDVYAFASTVYSVSPIIYFLVLK
jgi:hypothetical protein